MVSREDVIDFLRANVPETNLLTDDWAFCALGMAEEYAKSKERPSRIEDAGLALSWLCKINFPPGKPPASGSLRVAVDAMCVVSRYARTNLLYLIPQADQAPPSEISPARLGVKWKELSDFESQMKGERHEEGIIEISPNFVSLGNIMPIAFGYAARFLLSPIEIAVRDELIGTAKRGGKLTYGALMQRFRIPRVEIGRVVGKVSEFEHLHGRPLLSAIVVREDTGHPGGGFFGLSGVPPEVRRSTNFFDSHLKYHETKFVEAEQQRVWSYWSEASS